jgi:hypothetical protein
VNDDDDDRMRMPATMAMRFSRRNRNRIALICHSLVSRYISLRRSMG